MKTAEEVAREYFPIVYEERTEGDIPRQETVDLNNRCQSALAERDKEVVEECCRIAVKTATKSFNRWVGEDIEQAIMSHFSRGKGLMSEREQVLDWLCERYQNCVTIAAQKTGEDRAGWLEDSLMFELAMRLIRTKEGKN